jgi:regulator of protease activity HflC (stomatin/prohibitin superfamily)
MSKEEIAQDVKEQLTKSMETFGLAIIQTLLTDISPAAKVKAAMNEINAAQRLRAAAAQKAEAEKITVVKAAEADAEAKFLAGQGIARQRQAIINGLRESVQVLALRIAGYNDIFPTAAFESHTACGNARVLSYCGQGSYRLAHCQTPSCIVVC